MTDQEIIDAFRRAMAEQGVPYAGDIEVDGRFRRIYVEGDRRGSRNGWYIVHGDGTPAGAFGTNKGDQKYTWKADAPTKPLTAEERAEMRRRADERRAAKEAAERELQARAAARAQAMWDAAKPAADHPYLARKGVPAHELRIGDWVKERKEDGSTYVAAKGALLIPIRDRKKNIVNLQAIFATPLKQGEQLRDKDFIYGGRKKGCWFVIGKPTQWRGQLWVIICEGYATGASLHRATGLGVVVAFDAGNLADVAKAVRELMPAANILIAGDNDAWTTRHGAPWNPGIEKAEAAAKICGGTWAVPSFADVSSKPTDFNDLDALEGKEAILSQLEALLAPPEPAAPPAPEPEPEPEPLAIDPDDNGLEGPPAFPDEDEDDDGAIDTDGFFRVLGCDRDNIFVYQYEKKMIVKRRDSDWSEPALVTIAPLKWWEREFPGKEGMNKKIAHDWLCRVAFKRGPFDPNSIRGRGAWRDEGRIVFHFGDRLWVNGDLMDVTQVESGYVYERARKLRLPAAEPMNAADGKLIIETAKEFGWTRPASAILAAGWCAIAPICGALRWRPHIWITGGAGSGKSTILNEFIVPLMNRAAIYAQGNSTEAGIRQTLKLDSLPVIFEESEQNNDREAMRVQNIMSLIRQSSTESDAKTLKGTQGGEAMDFVVRSAFCLSSIQVGMKHQADVERFAVLGLRSSRTGDNPEVAAANWGRIKAAIAKFHADPDLPARLLRRSLALLPTTVQNIEIFAAAAAKRFGKQRDGDQYGALLAGAWSLCSTKLATEAEALAMIDRYDWSEYLEGSEVEESSKTLSTLLGRMIRMKGIDFSIYELVGRAADVKMDSCNLTPQEADGVLRRYGMMVIKPTTDRSSYQLLVANGSTELERLMGDTPFAADIKGQLLRVPGATKHKPESFNGTTARSVAIPLDRILDIRPPVYAPTAFDVDDELAF